VQATSSAPNIQSRAAVGICRLSIGVAVVVVLALAGAAWLGFKAAAISTDLNAANQLVPKLRNDVLRDDATRQQLLLQSFRNILQEHGRRPPTHLDDGRGNALASELTSKRPARSQHRLTTSPG
jgi:hypothetical protein